MLYNGTIIKKVQFHTLNGLVTRYEREECETEAS